MSEIFEADEPQADPAAGGEGAAVGIALQRARGRQGKARDPVADRYLERQEQLIARQMHHLDEQLRSAGLDRWFKRLKLASQAVILLAILVAVVGLGAIAWSAAHDRDLVIDGFSVPPDLAQHGSTGAAVATQLHDKLVDLQAATQASFEAVTVREKAPEARVEIPETGVSVGELNRLLHDWLGHETHVSGEVSRVGGGPDKGALALNIRVGGKPGVRLLAGDGDLDALLGKGAEQVYRDVEPKRYTAWLTQHGRKPEALVFLEQLAAHGAPADQGFALVQISGLRRNEIPLEAQRDLLVRSLPLDPTRGGLNNLAVTDFYLGRSELALKEARQTLEQRRRALPPGMTPEGRQMLLDTVTGNVGIDAGDYGVRVAIGCAHFHVSPCGPEALVRAIVAAMALDPEAARYSQAFGSLPVTLTALHDARNAEALLPLLRPRSDDPGGLAEAQEVWLEDDAAIRRVRGDWAGVLKDTDASAALMTQWPGLRAIPLLRWRPVAMAHLGDVAGARTAADAFAPECYPCLISHALVEEIAGNRPGADRWFAEAARQGPSLPFAEAAWAEALLARGDVAGSLKEAEIAERKNPRYADGSEAWGEALAAKGDLAGALQRYAEAAKLAPRWGRLRLMWGEALAKQGKGVEAKAQFAAAAAMDLTPSERTELARRGG